MRITLLLLLFLLPFIHSLNAQYTPNEVYSQETIYLQTGTFVKNDIKYPLGFFNANLKREMHLSKDAMLEYKKYERGRNLVIGCAVVSVGCLAWVLNTNNVRTQQGLLYTSLGVAIISIPLSIRSSNSLHKSIWLRNRDALQ